MLIIFLWCSVFGALISINGLIGDVKRRSAGIDGSSCGSGLRIHYSQSVISMSIFALYFNLIFWRNSLLPNDKPHEVQCSGSLRCLPNPFCLMRYISMMIWSALPLTYAISIPIPSNPVTCASIKFRNLVAKRRPHFSLSQHRDLPFFDHLVSSSS